MSIRAEVAMDSEAGVGAVEPAGQDGQVQLVRRSRLAVDGMTCGSCARRVEQALLSVPGVADASVDLAAGVVDVSYDVSLVSLAALQEAVSVAGYRLRESPVTELEPQASSAPGRRVLRWPLVAGAAGASFLTGLYVAIVGIAQGLEHAVDLLVGDWYFVIPIVVGFGIQVGLFVYVRAMRHTHHSSGSSKALAGAGTGTSTVSMVACCAHHVTEVLPIVGLSGAALFLNEYRGPLMALGILTNAVGIAVMVRLIRRSSCVSPVAGLSAADGAS